MFAPALGTYYGIWLARLKKNLWPGQTTGMKIFEQGLGSLRQVADERTQRAEGSVFFKASRPEVLREKDIS